MKKGVLIVIEGIDGSGKATQIESLSQRLTKEGKRVALADFPQYGKSSAYFVERYLRGEYGSAQDVGPHQASLFYALDRYEKSFDIRDWLSQGRIVISNRYVSASMGHQGGKLSPQKCERFFAWLHHLEYEILGLPKPDLTIVLMIDPKAAQKFVDMKARRRYTKGKKRDIHEVDLEHQRRALAAYRRAAKKYGWTVIECMKNKKVLPLADVHEKIFAAVKKVL